ncbi:MAG: hypothetical protein CMP20_12420 [Rickettsiales bacterium]|nr:hypothetical protein [Rickettsiales bacterium]
MGRLSDLYNDLSQQQAEAESQYIRTTTPGLRMPSPEPEPVQQEQEEEPGLLSDAWSSFGIGAGQLVKGVEWLFDTDTEVGQTTIDYWQGQLSDAQVEANEQRFVDEDMSLGEGFSNPRTWMGTIVQSLPMMVPGIGAAGGVAKLGIRAGMSKAGATAAGAAAGSSMEGATIGALVGEEVEATIMDAPIEELQNSPYFQDLIESGKDEAEARLMVAEKASEGAALQSGVLGAILGVAFNKFVGDAVTGRLSERLLKETGKGVAEGSVTEAAQTGVESYSKQTALNESLGRPYDYSEAANEIVGGTGAGGVMGGAVGFGGGLAGSNTPEQPTQTEDNPPIPQPDVGLQTEPEQPTQPAGPDEPAFDDGLDNIGQRLTEAENQPISIRNRSRNLAAAPEAPAPLSEQVGTDINAEGPQIVYQQDGITVEQEDNQFRAYNEDGLEAFGQDAADARRKLNRQIERNWPKGPILQNRDRNTPAYIAQMREIAQNPKYNRVSTSREPTTGAPMAFPRGVSPEVPAMNLGRTDTVTMSDGKGGEREVPVQYAVVEADQVQASHRADGKENPGYAQDGLIALNNGRTAGLQAAYEQGNTDAYVEAMLADDMHGIDPAAIRSKQRPMLVRLFDGQSLEGIDNPGDASNTSPMADLSLSEQAKTDAGKLDNAILSEIQPGDPTGSGNTDFVTRAVDAIGKGDTDTVMRDREGLLTSAGQRRIRGALIARAYSDDTLTQELVEATDSDLKTLGDALTEVAGRWALMREQARDNAINPDMDVTDALVSAVNMIRKSRQEGRSLKDIAGQIDAFAGEADQMAVYMLSLFYRGASFNRIRSKDAITGALSNYIETALQSSPGVDMFGEQTQPQEVLSREAEQAEGSTGEQAQEAAPRVQTDGPDNRDAGPEGEGSGREAGREEDAGSGEQVSAAGETENLTPDLAVETEQADGQAKAEQADNLPAGDGDQARTDSEADNEPDAETERDDEPEGAEVEAEPKAKPEAKKPEPKAESKPEPKQPDQPIEDFGEKIEGARKDYASKMKAAKEKDVAAVPLSESWPEPDYQKLVEAGADPFAVGFARALRDEIPTKPRQSWKLKGWAEQVDVFRQVAERSISGDISVDRIRETASQDRNKAVNAYVVNLADLYAEVGHSKSLKGLRFYSAHFSMFDGEKGSFDKWVVERAAKATAFSNMPRRLAAADTKEEALKQFRKVHESLNEQPKADKNIRFDIYSSRRDKADVFIAKKIGKDVVRIKDGFKTAAEAREYLAKNQSELESILSKMKDIPNHRKVSNSPRVGKDHRNGGDVTPEAFSEAFGFRGVQFGNFVEQGRRQQDLNEAYDGLMDLAGILNIPAKALSLNGELGLAFGARGKGGKGAASAHYERGNIVINLTKKSGAGSLAHEWFHALDNYFGRSRGGEATRNMATDGSPGNAVRPEVIDAFRNIRQTVNRIRMRERSQKLDKVRTKEYWSTDVEMTARAFESYVIEKLKDQQGANDYLANIVSEEYWKASEALGMQDSDSYPYPEAAEIPEIRAAYDNLFEVIETREGDAGNVEMYSRDGYRRTPETRTDALTAQQARTYANTLMRDWKDRPGVTVADSISEFPKPLREAIRQAGAESDMRAVFWNQEVYILAPRIPNTQALEEVILHEVVGHYGLRKMVGKELIPLLNRVYMDMSKTEQAAEIKRNYFPGNTFDASKREHRLVVAEELLAHLAESGKQRHRTLWQRIVTAIRDGLRRLGFTVSMNENDLLKILEGAQRTVEQGGFSRPSEADTYFRRAYHGTPHRFDKFSLEAIGTGEGAQAFGWGLYFAGNREIADYYRTEVSKVAIADRFLDQLPEDADYDEFVEWVSETDMPANEKEFMEALIADDLLGFEYPAQAINTALKKGNLDRYDPSPRLVDAVKNVGSIYEVEIPDDSDLLDYDKRLNDQPPGITDAVRAITDEQHGEGTFDSWMEANEEGGDYREWRDNLMEEVEDRDLSMRLNEKGVPGLRYLDADSRIDSANGQTHNYVIWDDSLVSVQAINDQMAQAEAYFSRTGTEQPMFSRAGNRLDAAATHFNDLTDDQRAALGKIAPRTPKERAQDWLKERTDRWQTKVRQGAVDRFAALADVDTAVHGRDVIENSTASSSWVLAQMSGSAAGALQSMLTTARVKLNQREKIITTQDGTQGLNDALKQLGSAAEIERFFGWIAGNRSRRLMAEGRENLFEPQEVEALAQLNRGTTDSGQSRLTLYDNVFRELQQYRDDVLAIAEQSGIITPEQRETWANEFYVPFYRLAEDDGSFTGPKATGGISRQEAYKKLKGGSRPLNDLLENTMMNFYHLLQASLKNQAAMQAMDNSQEMGIAREVREADRDTENSTFILRDGQKIWYEIDDPLVFKAVTALAHPGMNSTAMKMMRGFKRLFTNLTTTTPQFVIANLLRDSMQAAATSEVSKNILKNMAQGSKVYGDPKIRAKMLASGGSFSFGHLYGENADELRLRITGGLAQADILRSPSMIPNAISGMWRKWNEMTEFTENINRAAIFEQNQDRGELYAAFKARDLMNFSQHGAWPAMRVLIDVVPFLNARLQGLDKIYRSGVKPGLRTAMGQGTASEKQAAMRFWSVTGTLALASIALYLNNRDDEEYKKLEEWQRDSYWFFRVSDDHAIFIPKPFEVGAIATMAERLTEQAVSDTATGKLFASRLSHMLLDTFSFSPVPQMFQPALDIYSNYDAFTGRPIESMGMERLSPSLRLRNNTTALATGLSAATESVFGSDGRMTLSPVQIDHAIQGYFGSVGSWVAGIADTVWRTANGETAPSTFWYENQPVRRFYKNLGDEDRYTRYGTVFYEALKETNRVYADIKEYAELGEVEKARALYQENRQKMAYRIILNRVQRKLSEINNAMQKVRRLEASPEYKRRELDRLRALKNRMQEAVGGQIERLNASDS